MKIAAGSPHATTSWELRFKSLPRCSCRSFSAAACRVGDSQAPAASTSHGSCVCDVGEIYQNGTQLACGCPAQEAREGLLCVACAERFLSCAEGTELSSAAALPGHLRLGARAFRCLEPLSRCDGGLQGCHENYTGQMCMDCAPQFYANGNRCERCLDAEIQSLVLPAAFCLLAALLAIYVMRRCTAQALPRRWNALKDQVKAQMPVLLQMCQLWAVLAALAPPQAAETTWEVPYVQMLQLSVTSFKGAWNLQCRWDGPSVRSASALAAPLLPLLVLLCCLAAERKPGRGISLALQALTLFYVGGASAVSLLLHCQDLDGRGEVLPPGFAFRSALPSLRCAEDSPLKRRADVVGIAAAVAYAVVIPLCLVFLYGKQHRILGACKSTTTWATWDGTDLTVHISEVRGGTGTKDAAEHQRRLVAASAAYVAVLFRGRVRVQLGDGATVTPMGEVLEAKLAETLRCRRIAEMLTERAVLQDAEDRVLSGARQLLTKYARGRNIWMEIAQKLVAVGLVALVSSPDGLGFSLALTLTMAATSAVVQPYSLPQVNALHCCCFFCLALSALGFAQGAAQLARLALALPFALSALQARPDSTEALALRLWQELEPQMDLSEGLEVTVESFSFV